MKKSLLALLLTVCALWLCACGSTAAQSDASGSAQPDQSAQETGSSGSQATTEPDDAQSTDTQPTDGESQEPSDTTTAEPESAQSIPQVSYEYCEREWYSEDGTQWLLHLEYQTVSVSGCDTLDAAVLQWSQAQEEALLQYGDELAAAAQADAADMETAVDEPIYTASQSIETMRADGDLVSLLILDTSYTGGAHNSSAYSGVTFDASTGAVLSLEELLTDVGGFQPQATAYLINALEESCGDELFDDYATTVEETWDNAPVWYLDAAGITFVFNEYDVGPYSMGAVSVTLPYEEFGGYLNAGYAQPSGVAQLAANTEAVWSLSDAASGHVSVCTQGEDYSDVIVSLVLDDASTEVGQFARIGACYLLTDASGHSFVLLDADYASDDFVTFLYEITDGAAVLRSRLEDASLDGGMVNTARLTLSVHLDVLGSYSASMDYGISSDGTLEQLEEVFTIRSDSASWHLLTVKRELPVTIGGQQTTLAVGSRIRITGSDNAGTAYFRVEGTGAEGSVSYVRGNGEDNNWTLYIDGVSEDDYFDALPYAG